MERTCGVKVAILVGDGMSDYPIEELGGKTPLEAAKIHNMNEIAKAGMIGLGRDAGLPQGFQILDSSDTVSAIKRVIKAMKLDEERYVPKQVSWFIAGAKERAPLAAQALIAALGEDAVVPAQC